MLRKWWTALLIGSAAILALIMLWPSDRSAPPNRGSASIGRQAGADTPSVGTSSAAPQTPAARQPGRGGSGERPWAALALRDASTRRRSLNIDPDAAILFERAEGRMRNGDWDGAIIQFREVINRHPTADWVPLAFASIADAHLLKGDLNSLRQARSQFDSYLGLYADSPGAESAALKRNLLNLLLDAEGRLRSDAGRDLLQFLRGSPDEEAARLAEYLLDLTEVLPRE